MYMVYIIALKKLNFQYLSLLGNKTNAMFTGKKMP